jgi:tRNA 2-thiouridine synthesizing protein B
MPVLHLVSRSPRESQALACCLARAGASDVVLLSENGVYAALTTSEGDAPIRAALGQLGIYALKPDLEARGIASEELLEGVQEIDYEGFVDLAVHYPLSHSWF